MARVKADLEGDCPLFLSQRLRRVMESVLRVPIAEPVGSELVTSALEEHVAKAVAKLTFHHHLPPSYVQCPVVGTGSLNTSREVYAEYAEAGT